MKKKIISTILAFSILISILVITKSAFGSADPSVSNSGRRVDVGYLLRENFPSIAFGTPGWTKANLNTGASTGLVTDSSRNDASYMYKQFISQSEDTITVEFKVLVIKATTGGEIKLKNGTQDAITLTINNNELLYKNHDFTDVKIAQLDYSDWVGVKLICDISNKKVDIMIDGKKVTTQPFNFTNNEVALDRIFFGIDNEGVGAYQLGTVYIYKGYQIYEDLISAKLTYNTYMMGNINLNKSTRATAQNQQVANNNTTTNLAVDGDYTTYWQGDEAYAFDGMAYIVEYKGKIAKIDKLVLAAPSSYTATLNFTYQDPSGAWKGVPTANWLANKVVGDSTNPTTVVLSEPFYAKAIAITFRKPDTMELVQPKIAEFEAYFTGAAGDGGSLYKVPTDWNYDISGGDVQVSDYGAYSEKQEYNTFKLTDTSFDKNVSLSKSMLLNGSSIFDFDFMFSQISDGMTTQISQDNQNKINIFTKGNNVCATFTGIDTQFILAENYKKNIWYRTSLIYDKVTNSIKPSVNGWSPFEAVTVDSSFGVANFTEFKAYTDIANKGEMFVDNIRISSEIVRKIVPKPVPIDTGDNILNMQSCSLWREGTHLGWSALDRDSTNGVSRKPILGWYDEGDPEVADWEIKWLREHGISSLMYCWYRNDTGPGPIKESRLADQMWEGLFKAKYRDMMKFTIMFTDHAAEGSIYSYDDIMNNLLPYWIETFFRNPNYQKTADNKPIVYIYSTDLLLSKIGDVDKDGVPGTTADANKLFIDMRQATKDAGFGGLVISAEYRGKSNAAIKKISDCGYDFMFAYTWHPTALDMTNQEMLDSIKSSLTLQKSSLKKYGKTKIVPNISKSWDPRGWTEVGFGSGGKLVYTFDFNGYKQEAEWMRDIYGGTDIDNSGKKMIMLDNWNEFAEGHYLLPTYGEPGYKGGKRGFGYLDILREVFGVDNKKHTDNYPLQEGFGPYDKWYPNGWDSTDNPGFEENDGVVPDNSPVFDSVLKKNAFGGDTTYNELPLFEDIINNLTEEYLTIDNRSSIRVNVDAQILELLKNNQKGIKVITSSGEILIPKEIIATLDMDKSLDVIMSKLIDVTQVRNILKDNSLVLVKENTAYNIELMQSNKAISYIAPISVTLNIENATKYKLGFVNNRELINIDSITYESGNMRFNLTSNGTLGIIYK